MYTYVRSEPELWTVGHHDNDGRWQPESDHGSTDDAAARVHWLNGGSEPADTFDAERAELHFEVAKLRIERDELRRHANAVTAERDQLRAVALSAAADLNEALDDPTGHDLVRVAADAATRINFATDDTTPTNGLPEPLGHIVLIREGGKWNAIWDGVVHTTREAGEKALHAAQAAKYEAELCDLVPLGYRTGDKLAGTANRLRNVARSAAADLNAALNDPDGQNLVLVATKVAARLDNAADTWIDDPADAERDQLRAALDQHCRCCASNNEYHAKEDCTP